MFVHRLREDGLDEQVSIIGAWWEYCLDLAVAVASETKNTPAHAELVTMFALFDFKLEGNPM